MLTRVCFLIATWVFAPSDFNCPAPARSGQADDLVLVVAASYPGANAQEVAETIAAPIEQQINGVKGVTLIESISGNDGKYIAKLHFSSMTDPKSVVKLVQNRVALARPSLPDVVQRNGISTKVGKAEVDQKQVVLVVIDRQSHGWKALEKTTGAVMKRLATEGAITKPAAFPHDEKQVSIEIDRAKCAARGVSVTDVHKAVLKGGSAAKIEALNKLVVRGTVSLADVAALKEVTGPSAIYRVNLHPAIRITGTPPNGKSVAEAAARCLALAEAEMKRSSSNGFAAENLSAK